MSSSLKLLEQFSPGFTWAFYRKGVANLFRWFHAIEQDGRHPQMVKTRENLLQNKESFGTESWYIASRTQALQ